MGTVALGIISARGHTNSPFLHLELSRISSASGYVVCWDTGSAACVRGIFATTRWLGWPRRRDKHTLLSLLRFGEAELGRVDWVAAWWALVGITRAAGFDVDFENPGVAGPCRIVIIPNESFCAIVMVMSMSLFCRLIWVGVLGAEQSWPLAAEALTRRTSRRLFTFLPRRSSLVSDKENRYLSSHCLRFGFAEAVSAWSSNLLLGDNRVRCAPSHVECWPCWVRKQATPAWFAKQ